MIRRTLIFLMSLYLTTLATASSVYSPGGIFIDGTTTGVGMSTNDFANGSGSNNVNKVDHAAYADLAGGTAGTAGYAIMSGSSSNAAPGSPLAGQVSTGLEAGAWVIANTNDAKLGNSLIIGPSNSLSGHNAMIMGNNNLVAGNGAVAIGAFNQAAADGAFVAGHYVVANGNNAFGLGQSNNADGADSVALGNGSSAVDDNTFVWSDTTPYTSTNARSFNVYATGGTRLDGGRPTHNGTNLLLQGEVTQTTWGGIAGTLNNQTDLWNYISWDSNLTLTAAANALYASNGVVTLNASTGLWNTVSGVSNTATFASNGVVTLNGSTGLWNTVSGVSNTATFASNGVVTLNGSTGLWNTVSSVSNNATFASNGVVTLNGSTGLWNTVSGVSNTATTAAANALYASNGVVTLAGSTSSWNTASSWVQVNSNTVASNTVILSQISRTWSVTTNITFTSATATNVTIPLVMNGVDITDAKLYVADTNTMPFGSTVIATFYNNAARAPGGRLPQFACNLACVSNTTVYAVGVTNLAVPDASSFAINDMVWLPGSTGEFAVISGFTGTTNILLETALTNSHAVGSGVMLAKELGGFQVYDVAGSTNVFLQLTCTNAITVNLQLILNYSK